MNWFVKHNANFEKKDGIFNTSRLAKKTDLNTKSTEIENQIPSIVFLATNSVLAYV